MSSWIVQATPKEFMIDYFLDEYATCHMDEPDWWIIEPRYEDKVKIGDTIYIWKAKSEPPKKNNLDYFTWMENIGRKEQVSGIFAAGKIISRPKLWEGIPIKENECIKKYRVDKTGHQWDRFAKKPCYWSFCQYKDIKVRNPLLQKNIWKEISHSKITDLTHFETVRQRSSIKLEEREAEIIKKLFDAK